MKQERDIKTKGYMGRAEQQRLSREAWQRVAARRRHSALLCKHKQQAIVVERKRGNSLVVVKALVQLDLMEIVALLEGTEEAMKWNDNRTRLFSALRTAREKLTSAKLIMEEKV